MNYETVKQQLLTDIQNAYDNDQGIKVSFQISNPNRLFHITLAGDNLIRFQAELSNFDDKLIYKDQQVIDWKTTYINTYYQRRIH